MKGSKLGFAATLLASVGLFIAGVLSLSHLNQTPVPCGGSTGCEDVLNSQYARLFGIPVAFIGLGGYLCLLALSILLRGSRTIARIGFGVSLFGALASASLTLLSLIQIHATCRWCIASAFTMVALLAVWTLILRQGPSPSRAPWLTAVLLAAVAVAGAVGVSNLSTPAPTLASAKRPVVDMEVLKSISRDELMPKDAAWKGTEDGKIQLIEFADFACPACRDVYGRLKKLLAEFTGIRLVYRHLPQSHLPGHEGSIEGAICGELANRAGKFWDYADRAVALEGHPKPSDYQSLLRRLDVDPEKGRAEAAISVERDRALAKRLGMKLTPIFILLSPDLPPKATTNLDLTEALNDPKVISYLNHS